MNETSQYQLIAGVFDPQEAGKIVFSLIGNKINYHTKEKLSIQERYNGDVSHSEKRVEELNRISTALRSLIDDAIEQRKQLQINSVIEIQFV